MKMLTGYYDFILELHSDNVKNVRLKWYADIDEKEFEEIISADPTTIIKNNMIKKIGNYSKWLLHLYKTGNLLLEDLYKATEYLTLHKNNYSTLSKINKKLLNLFNFKTLPELYDAIAAFDKPKNVVDEKTLITNRYYFNINQAKLVFEDDNYLVITPLTIEAEQFYGINSKWCTLRPDQWENYSKKGPLYIIINKNKLNSKDPNRRLQLQIQSSQYMDMDDRRVEYTIALAYLKNKPEMRPIVDELIEKTGILILDSSEVLDMYMNGTAEEIKKTIPKYYDFSDYTDEEYLQILDRVSKLLPKFTDIAPMKFFTTNRVIDDERYLKVFAKLKTDTQLEILLATHEVTILKPYLNDDSAKAVEMAGDLLTDEKPATVGEITSILGNNFSKVVGNVDLAFDSVKSKSDKWKMGMLLYCLDNIADVSNQKIKQFLLKFTDELQTIKRLNKPGGESRKFMSDVLDSLYSREDINESVKQDKINKIKRRQIRLEILLGE